RAVVASLPFRDQRQNVLPQRPAAITQVFGDRAASALPQALSLICESFQCLRALADIALDERPFGLFDLAAEAAALSVSQNRVGEFCQVISQFIKSLGDLILDGRIGCGPARK